MDNRTGSSKSAVSQFGLKHFTILNLNRNGGGHGDGIIIIVHLNK